MNHKAPPRTGRPQMPQGYGVSQDLEGTLPWDWAAEQLERSKNYWVCTTCPDGRPHAMPVWGLWNDGAIWFSTGRTTRKARNLAENPRLTIHLESGDDVVILEGTVAEVKEKGELQRLLELYKAKYNVDPPLLEPSTVNYRLAPSKALGWRERSFPKSATRWVF